MPLNKAIVILFYYYHYYLGDLFAILNIKVSPEKHYTGYTVNGTFMSLEYLNHSLITKYEHHLSSDVNRVILKWI